MVTVVDKMVRNGIDYAPRTIAKAVSMEDGTSLDVAMTKSQSPYAGVTTNIGNAYSIAGPVISELKEGMAVRVKINNDSTGAATLNWNGKGAKDIKKANGSDVTNLKAGGIYTLVYGGVNFQLQGEGASGNATASDLLSGKTATTDAGEIVGTMPSKSAATYNPSQSIQTISAGQYLSGNQTISAVAFDDSKVLTGTTIAGKAGTMPNRGTVASTITTQGGQYTIPAGYHSGSGKVTASFANLVAGNIKEGVNIGSIIGNLKSRLYATGTGTVYSGGQRSFTDQSGNSYSQNSVTLNMTTIPFTPIILFIYKNNSPYATTWLNFNFYDWSGYYGNCVHGTDSRVYRIPYTAGTTYFPTIINQGESISWIALG